MPRFYAHSSALAIKSKVPSDIWKSYYKFCFDRNPFDRYISFYNWAGGDKEYGSIKNFMDSDRGKNLLGIDLYAYNSNILVDKVYLYESLNFAIDDLNKKFNLKNDEKIVLQ